METVGITSDFLGVTKASMAPSDWTSYSKFFQDDEIILNKFENTIFRIFDRIFYQAPFPSKLFLAIFAIMHIQGLFGNNIYSSDRLYTYIVTIFEITKANTMPPNLFYTFGFIFVGITFATWIFFIIVSCILTKQKYISTIPLVILSFLIFIIFPLLIHPTSFIIKRLIILTLMMSSYRKNPNNPIHTNFLLHYRNDDFLQYYDEITDTDMKIFIVLIVFLVISFILQTVMTLISFLLLSSTPYIPYHGLTGLSMKAVFYSIFLRPIIRFVESFFCFYPRWTIYFLFSSNIVLYLLLLYFLFLFPLIHSVSNSLLLGYSISGVFGSILKLVYVETIDGTYYPHFLAMIAVYVLIAVISFLILKFRLKKKYLPLLAYNGEVNIADTPLDKRSSLLVLSITQKDDIIRQRVFEDERLQIIPYSKKVLFSFVRIESRLKLMNLIKVGVENGCDLLIDYTLFKFIISTFPEDREMLKLLSTIEMGLPWMRANFQHILPIIRIDVMKFSQRFLIFEINTLNKLTETELSSSSNQEISIVRSNANKFQETVMNTWLLEEISLSSLMNVMTTVNDGDKMWNWIFTKYPNLKEAHRIYLQYLIECKTDFHQSEVTKKQLNRIENHRLTIKDKSFISFVRTFPIYITHNLVNPNGSLADFANNETQFREDSDGSIENLSSLSEPTDYDSKLRFAIFKATHKLKAYSSFYMQIIIYIFFAIFIVSECCLAFIYYFTINDMNSSDILRFYIHLSSNLSLSNAYVLLKYGTIYTNKSVNNLHLLQDESTVSYRFNFFDYYYNFNYTTDAYFETTEDTLDFNILSSSLNAVKSYQLLFSELKNINQEGFLNVDHIEQLMFFDQVPIQLCYRGIKMQPVSFDFAHVLIEHTINQVDISYRQNMEVWLNSSNSFCNIFSSFASIIELLKKIRFETYTIFIDKNIKNRDKVILISSLIASILTVIYLIFFTIVLVRYKKELRCFADILSSLDEEVKKNGSYPILITSSINRTNESTATNNNNISEKNIMPIKFTSKKVLYYSYLILCFFLIVIQGVFLFLIGFVSYQMKNHDIDVTYWNFYNKLKIPQYLEMFDSLSLSCILRTHLTNATTYTDERQHCFDIIEDSEASDTYLVSSSDGMPSILGKSSKFDNYYLKSTCDSHSSEVITPKINQKNITLLADNDTNSSDDPFEWLDDTSVMYSDEEFECMSLSNKMLIYLQITRDVLQKLGKEITTHSLNDYIVSRIAYLYYILNKYLINDIEECNNLIMEIGNDYLFQSRRNLIIMFIASIIFSIICFAVTLYFKSFLDSIYSGGLILVRRLVPNEMAANHRLVSFLLNKGLNKKNINKEMNITQSIVHYSSDMIFYANNNGIILITNQAIFQNLNYSPEQIVGKPISSLFEEESKKEIQRQIAILEKDENQMMAHLNVTCITANNTQLYVSLMIFQMSSNHLVFIMKNLTEIIEKQRIAQQMRNNCIALYFSILPSFVAKLLNNEEKDISFMVPTATIMFVDIAHFAEFSRTLSPEQLLGILSSIYDQYGSKLREYSSLTKIKIIGDCLMVAGGLFNNQLDHNKSLGPTSSSNMGTFIGIPTDKYKESPTDNIPKVPIIGGPVIGFSKTIDILPPSLSGTSSIISAGGSHPDQLVLINNNHSDYVPHQSSDGTVQIYPSYSNVEAVLQAQEQQIISQNSKQRIESDFMTPDAFVASQAIRFGFDCIEVIEDINLKNNFNLAIRIGISTGGPIIAGVLGDDKLDFEIFGEEISFASKIQSTGIPGNIVISDSTYNLVSNLDQYPFEDRMIFIKKKGNIRTHIVHPP